MISINKRKTNPPHKLPASTKKPTSHQPFVPFPTGPLHVDDSLTTDLTSLFSQLTDAAEREIRASTYELGKEVDGLLSQFKCMVEIFHKPTGLTSKYCILEDDPLKLALSHFFETVQRHCSGGQDMDPEKCICTSYTSTGDRVDATDSKVTPRYLGVSGGTAVKISVEAKMEPKFIIRTRKQAEGASRVEITAGGEEAVGDEAVAYPWDLPSWKHGMEMKSMLQTITVDELQASDIFYKLRKGVLEYHTKCFEAHHRMLTEEANEEFKRKLDGIYRKANELVGKVFSFCIYPMLGRHVVLVSDLEETKKCLMIESGLLRALWKLNRFTQLHEDHK